MANGQQGQAGEHDPYLERHGLLGAPPPEPPIALPGVPDTADEREIQGVQGIPGDAVEHDPYLERHGLLGADKDRETRKQHFGDIGEPQVPREVR